MPLDPGSIAIYIAAVKALIEGWLEIGKLLERTYGIIHKAWPARINGKAGYLIWDYALWNEITFLPDDGGKIVRFSNALSDADTDAEFETLVKKFGVA